MLFDYHLFTRIERGEITLTFRNWTRPQAKAGARHRLNAHGVLAIDAVDIVPITSITASDAKRAGFDSRQSLLDAITRRGTIPDSVYRIAFHFVREGDARSALARGAALSDADFDLIRTKLERMDARSEHGAWTRQTLRLITDNPRVISTVLAKQLGRERMAFKLDVRKLKALGLTISHEVGYEISPRGRAFLDREATRR
jgi:hypothetical protein